jgi:ATP-dependent Lon protease
LIQIPEQEVESLDLRNHSDHTIYEYAQKHHENLFATKEMVIEIASLKEEFPNFHKVIDYVLRHALFSLKKQIPMFLPAININGDPSIGKTFFVKRLSKALTSDFYSLSVSTLLSSHELTGLSRYWGNAGTGLIFNNIVKKAKYAQSVMLLDEICKATFSSMGNGSNIANALISIMDKEQAKEFTETCLDVEIDVSRVLVFSTSNQVEKLPDVLRSRLVNFNVSKPDKTQLNKIINSMVKNILQELQIKEDEMPLVIERETSDLFYGADLRDVREILKNHILTEYIDSGVESDTPYTLYH